MELKKQHPAWIAILMILDGIVLLVNMSTGGARYNYNPINPPQGVAGLPSWFPILGLGLGIISLFIGLRLKFFIKNDESRFSNYLIWVGISLICFALFAIFLLNYYSIPF